MEDGSGDTLRRVERSGLPTAASLYLLAFLGVVAIAPHRHLNSFEDLASGGRSDSGIFLERNGRHHPPAGEQWNSARWLDDDPCLACFHNDWATAPVALLGLTPGFRPVSLSPRSPEPFVPPAPVLAGRSRSPPPAA